MDNVIVFIFFFDHGDLFWPLDNRADKLVVAELAFLDATIRQYKSALSMLQTFAPITFVKGAITPFHLSKSFSEVHPVVALVPVATLPDKDSWSVLHIVEKVAFVLIAIGSSVLFPLASPILNSIRKVANVRCSIFPFVAAESLRFSAVVISCICVSIGKRFCALAVFQIFFPFTFVAIAVLPLVDTVAEDFATAPLTDI